MCIPIQCSSTTSTVESADDFVIGFPLWQLHWLQVAAHLHLVVAIVSSASTSWLLLDMLLLCSCLTLLFIPSLSLPSPSIPLFSYLLIPLPSTSGLVDIDSIILIVILNQPVM